MPTEIRLSVEIDLRNGTDGTHSYDVTLQHSAGGGFSRKSNVSREEVCRLIEEFARGTLNILGERE